MSFLFGGKPSYQPQPAVRMPDSQSPSVLEAARRFRAGLVGRSGRASTIMTGTGTGSGTAPVYQNTTMGGAS